MNVLLRLRLRRLSFRASEAVFRASVHRIVRSFASFFVLKTAGRRRFGVPPFLATQSIDHRSNEIETGNLVYTTSDATSTHSINQTWRQRTRTIGAPAAAAAARGRRVRFFVSRCDASASRSPRPRHLDHAHTHPFPEQTQPPQKNKAAPRRKRGGEVEEDEAAPAGPPPLFSPAQHHHRPAAASTVSPSVAKASPALFPKKSLSVFGSGPLAPSIAPL